jgi:hypothetical protein
MSSILETAAFQQVVDDHHAEKIAKKQALNELEEKYKSATDEIKQKIKDILEKSGFYRFVPCSPDELILVYDKTANSKSDLERKELEKTINKILSVIPVEFMEEFEGNDADHQASIAVYQERDKIAGLCQESREITECYEKYKAEIEGRQTPAYEEQYFMMILKNEAPEAYKVMKECLKKGLVEYIDSGYFNFKCNKGCVGLLLAKAGYTEWKRIISFILINGEKCELVTLQNSTKNTPPKEWKEIEKIFWT